MFQFEQRGGKVEKSDRPYEFEDWKTHQEVHVDRNDVLIQAGALAENDPKWSKDASANVKRVVAKVSIRNYLKSYLERVTGNSDIHFDILNEEMISQDAEKMLEMWDK